MGETAPKTVVDTQQGHYIGHYIVELKDLALITDDDFIESFKGSISTIFKYNRKDIQQTIEPRDINLLKRLRIELSELLQSVVPTLTGRTLGCRRIKPTVSNDICLLGASICDRSPAKELEKLYQAESAERPDEISESVDETPELTDEIPEQSDEIPQRSDEIPEPTENGRTPGEDGHICRSCSTLSRDVKRIREIQTEQQWSKINN